MSGYRQIHTRMWSSDRWFTELKPEFKLLFMYLFSNERASVSGLYELPLNVAAFETGLGRDVIEAGFAEFAQANKVYYDTSKGVVYVCNMFKYQGSNSPKLLARIRADIKTVPDCSLKEKWLNENSVLIGYADGRDTSLSVSISSSSSVSGEGGGAGEETKPVEDTDWIPETPKQASEHPDIQTYQRISGRFPGVRDYQGVIETVRFLREQHGDRLDEFLKPYWLAWSTRKNKDNRPYNPASLVWLYEWAMQGDIPKANGHEPKIGEDRKTIIRKVAQHAR